MSVEACSVCACLGAAKVFIIADYGQRGAEVCGVRGEAGRDQELRTLLMVRDRQYVGVKASTMRQSMSLGIIP